MVSVMNGSLNRRDFLKLSVIGLSTLAFNPLSAVLPPEDLVKPIGIGRVANPGILIYQEPSFKSKRLGWRKRDSLLTLVEEMHSPYGPIYNPTWYRTVGGYVHSAYLQRVEGAHLNEPLDNIPEGGQLGEVTVPYFQSLRYTHGAGWFPLYRLYYSSVHWITHIDEGPDGKAWYGITNERLHVVYYIPAEFMRSIPMQEISPISSDVPPQEKWIKVSVDDQTLSAYEGDTEVLHVPISSGVADFGVTENGIPTDTPTGTFHVSLKTPSRHMGDGDLTSDYEAYELLGVPWVNIFHAYGVGFHGTYWHNNFGNRMSHGCVNMRNEDAKWLYRWTTPITTHADWYKQGRGTTVYVI